MKLRRVAAFVVCVGCGRIGFDATTHTGDAALDDVSADGSAAGIVVVQSRVNETTTVTSLTVAVASTRPGSLLVVLAGTTPGHAITSLTDDAGNTYVSAGAYSQDANSGESDYYYCANAIAGATAVTVTANTSSCGILFYELAGARTTAPLAQVNALSSQSISLVPVGAPITTTAAGEMILTNVDVQGNVTGLRASSFSDDAPAMYTDGAAHLVAATPGTYMASWDQDAPGTYATSTVAFFAAP